MSLSLDYLNCYNPSALRITCSVKIPNPAPTGLTIARSITVVAARAAGSAEAANMERGSVPSRTLLSGSTTELEDEEDVEEVLPFRLTFFVFDSVTCGENLWR